MKTKLFSIAFLAAALVAGACGNKAKDGAPKSDSTSTATAAAAAEPTDDYDAWPWDFPQNVKPEAKVGQKVFFVWPYSQTVKSKKNLLKETVKFYIGTLETIGDKTSTIDNDGRKEEVPNALIIPIPEGQTARVGDVVLGVWSNSAQDMRRCLVTSAADPASPMTTLLDFRPMVKNGDIEIRPEITNNKQEPNSFITLKEGEWMPGMPVVIPEEHGKEATATIVCVAGDKVMVLKNSPRLRAFSRSECRLMPLKPKLKEGDKVKGMLNFQLADYTVKSAKHAKDGFYLLTGTTSAQPASILEIVKE